MERVAREMAAEIAGVNARSWREAAMKGTKSREIYRALQTELSQTGIQFELRKIAQRNARLISSLPYDISQKVTLEASKLYQQGARASEVEAYIRKLAPRLTQNRVKLIARTELGRAESEISKARAEQIGINYFQWQTSEDSRVRKSHRFMQGVVCAWNMPPNPERLAGEPSKTRPYLPGAIWNCRCVGLPIADLSEIRWPARVFNGSSIVRMSRSQFAKMAGMPVAA